MILAGDIGGTKAILAIFDTDGVTCLKKQHYACADYASFTDLLTDFLRELDNSTLTVGCLGVAGPIINGDCITTNLPWQLSHQDIARQLGVDHVYLLNDLAATAWGILGLNKQHFVPLNANAQPKTGHIAILAAGTGLGEVIIAWDGEHYHVIAGEGGHSDFAPNNAQEIDLLRYLLQKHPDHVSCERLISGEGLCNIYQFLKDTGYAPAQASIEEKMATSDMAAVIGEAGVAGSDALCVEALALFCRLYGSEAGNLAIKCLPYAGVYLAGGISPKILPFLQASEFMPRYLAKGRLSNLLQQIPVNVCINPEVGLLGAVSYALKMTT